MKRFSFLILAVFFSFAACSPSKNIDSDFNKCMKIVEDYDSYIGPVSDTILARFYFATNYLERISGVAGSFVDAEPPHYKTRSDCRSDLRKWRNWYDGHIEYLTQDRSDSLKREIARDNIWWSDSTILDYVFDN